jgi:hypothetical protein
VADNIAVRVTHQDFWRGNEHKWSTVYPYYGTYHDIGDTLLDAIHDLDSEMCYPDPDIPGITTEVAFYNLSSGGTSLISKSYADPYAGTCWASVDTVPAVRNRETCLVLNWPGGLSRTGKPVNFRKYVHAVADTDVANGSSDLSGTIVTEIEARMTSLITALSPFGLAMGNSRRFAGSAVVVDTYYGNHQMPRGRRRKST